jgi:hypothetical protein
VDYREATLAIDLIDAATRSVVWRGVAEGRLGTDELEQPGAAVDLAVSEIFAGFPGSAGQ